MVELIDRNVGRICQTLAQTGLDESTMVIFTSDHGELLGDHGLWLKGPFFYEGLVSTPLLISAPGLAREQATSALSSAIDLAGTVCEALGLEIPSWCEGVSLMPVLRGQQATVRESCTIEYRNGYGENDVASRTLVTDRYKYTRYQTGQEEGTDLQEDPAETTNLARGDEADPTLVALRSRLLDAILAGQSRYPQQICHA
jgi:arylsulfatase A-like enzyme